MKSIFDQSNCTDLIDRINKLNPNSQPQWGKMSVDQMLAHLCVMFESTYENIHPKPGKLLKLILKYFVKNSVVNETPSKKNSRTAPYFIISGHRDFSKEKNRLIDYINKTNSLGVKHFEGKESDSFGPLTSVQWSNMFVKHLDHHLTQFGV